MLEKIRQWGNHRYRLWRAACVVTLLSSGLMGLPAVAVRLADGTVQFAGVPLLGRVSTTNNQAWSWGATYLFTLQIPDDASEPLGRVVLEQKEGVDTVKFKLKRTYVYLNSDRDQKVTVEAVQPEPNRLELRFETPVAPGSVVTLGLRPYQNPSVGGVYLFGVTAFPAGEQVRSQFIGYGRLQFYDNSLFRHSGFGWR